LEYKDGQLRKNIYWRIEYTNEKSAMDFNNLKSEFLEVLRNSVRSELDQSGKVGCFLSGGTDSSTVAGILGEVSGEQANTYSIGFDERGFDESEYARIAVSHFNTKHKMYYVTPDDVVNLVGKIADIYGQPFGNSSVVPTYYCAKLAKEDGIGKLLGGDGGDELFGGNERYAKQMLFSRYDAVPSLLKNLFIEPALNLFPFSEKITPVHKAKRYVEQASTPMPERLTTYNYINLLGTTTILNGDFLKQIDEARPLKSLTQMYENSNAQSIINKMQTMDMKITLADNDLLKVTKMCEVAGVEIGYPLLNTELVNFSARLPVKQKVRGNQLRYFFKQALKEFLPQEIITKQKHGFGLPFGKWMVSDPNLRQLSFDTLSDIKKRNIIRPEFIDDLINTKLQEHANYYGGIAWILMILEYWYQSNES
jgi:asparagine synthase (glutamine-hydrolysing)